MCSNFGKGTDGGDQVTRLREETKELEKLQNRLPEKAGESGTGAKEEPAVTHRGTRGVWGCECPAQCTMHRGNVPRPEAKMSALSKMHHVYSRNCGRQAEHIWKQRATWASRRK